MSDHRLFYYPYASFTDEELPLLKVAALYFDKLIILDPVGASWTTVGADQVARDAITLPKGAGILEIGTPADVLAKYGAVLTKAVRRDMADRKFLDLCDAQAQVSDCASPGPSAIAAELWRAPGSIAACRWETSPARWRGTRANSESRPA